ncbi:MAG: patatin-like phospholipase family protein [Acidobacteria bacterium]|nr:patatin-like phospholipase family protein [Acidobacteriota bacterium]
MVRGWSKIALALGGGAARGLAHIGVLQVLEEEQIPVHLITGTSVGALVGGVYARTLSARLTREKFTAFARSREFRRSAFDFLRESRKNRPGVLYSLKTLFKRGIFYGTSMTRASFISAENFEHNINSLVDDVDFRDAGIGFAALAVCLSTGEEVILREGSLRRAVKASCAIPGVLPPVEFDGRLLIDGGWLNKVPVLPAFRLGARAVIAVDISQDLEDTQAYRKGYDIMVRANAIRSVALKHIQCRFADVLIRPRVDHIHWADFSAVEEAVRLGEEAARQALPAIRTLLRRRRWAAFLDPVRPCLCDRLLPRGGEGRGESSAGSL